jgi:hypothetical protein
MGWYANHGGGLSTARSHSQQELRQSPHTRQAARLFEAMLRTPLMPFVGRILEVFGPPKSVGFHFAFAPDQRERFVELVDPRALPKRMSLAMRREGSRSPLVPDDPGRSDPNWLARRQAARNGLGISFRQEGVEESLHVAYDRTECDVHVDRNGFVVRHPDGRVHWDLSGLLRHLTVDLIPDKAPWAAVSVGYRDKRERPIVQATLAPWVAVDLPSKENGGRAEVKAGLLFKGNFDAL